MCERGKKDGGKAQVTIFDNLRKKRTIPDPDSELDMGITAREFLDAAFSPKNEKEHLITLSGDPDWEIILWKWDTFKLLARIPLHVTVDPNPLVFQCSIQNIATELKIVVTGNQTYRYMNVSTDLHSINLLQQELFATSDDGHEVSKDYSCHIWTKDTMQLLVCTNEGDMLLLNHSGEFLKYIPESPYGCSIDSICAFSRGLIVAGEGGNFWAFEGSTNEAAPYKLQ